MLPNGRRLGAHLPLGHGMVKAADRAAAIGASAIQVFTDNPTSWRRRPSLPRELGAFRDRLAALDIAPLSVHAPYLVNLAGPDPDLFGRSVDLLASELRVAEAYGASYLNVHLGSHRGEGLEAGAIRVAEGIRRAEAMGGRSGRDGGDGGDGGVGDGAVVGDGAGGVSRPPMIALENGAGGGFGLGASVGELALVARELEAAGVPDDRVGFCLDTAHLWGAGYAIDTPEGVDELLSAFDGALGLRRLRMVHLNDSRSERGSRADRHEHVAAGRIGATGLRRFLEHPGLAHVVYIIETPGMDDGYDAINLRRVLDLAAGKPLAALPAEAFQTRSAKGRSAPAEDEDGA